MNPENTMHELCETNLMLIPSTLNFIFNRTFRIAKPGAL